MKRHLTLSLVTIPETPISDLFLLSTTVIFAPVKSALTIFEHIEAWCSGFVGSSLLRRVEMYYCQILLSLAKVSYFGPSSS